MQALESGSAIAINDRLFFSVSFQITPDDVHIALCIILSQSAAGNSVFPLYLQLAVYQSSCLPRIRCLQNRSLLKCRDRPAFLCLWLSGLAQSREHLCVESFDVGGIQSFFMPVKHPQGKSRGDRKVIFL
ncbi:MAG: hypothetical protein CM15mP120_23060 [Pseudomonadota bacterium]|nr:MAG: hypothetical protein CM15mP120_23060 [Pseudomonadota bacterium]